MRIYLDLCCLKRPFDDLHQARVRLESEAVLAILTTTSTKLTLLHSATQDVENDQNPNAVRAERVRDWLDAIPMGKVDGVALRHRAAELMVLGFKEADALHLASAEGLAADAFATCDDRLHATAARNSATLKLRVCNPVDLVREALP